ncbi:MAG: TonB-dependent receptor plug domain-containing protein [Longimicrobiales bacterium]
MTESFLPRTLAALAIVACFTTPVAAQRPASTDTTQSQPFPLDPVVVSASKRSEKALDAPAHVEVITAEKIQKRPAINVVDHLRGTAGVDVIEQGLFAQNVAVRGFNNLFIGALMVLTDNRIASLPSLRANMFSALPIAQEDIDRIEVVLGPGSALYGPNTANGVLHIITKSPLEETGSVATIGGGERNLRLATFRTAQRLSDNLGVKVSGQYLAGKEWRHTDPAEVAAREVTLPNDPATRIGLRDFDLQRWTGEVRLDWRLRPDATAVFSVGQSVASGIEVSGIGAAQLRNWRSSYYQARISAGRLFGQVYLNTTDSGDSFFLRNGRPTSEGSRMLVTQLQHGLSIGTRQSFTYGVDYLRTMPETRGLLHGVNEEDDTTDELGAYLQSETHLHPSKLDLVLAGRVDRHSEIGETVFSPRAALVFKPAPEQSLRFTYNRAFTTPASVNFFLDLDNGPAGALGQLGYHAHVGGNRTGFSFATPNDFYQARSPFTPAAKGGADAVIDARGSTLYHYAVGALAATGQITEEQAAALRLFTPADGDIGLVAFDPFAGTATPLVPGAIADVPSLTVSSSQSFELGYRALLAQRLLVTADVWYSRIDNFISRPQLRSPLVLLNGEDVGRFLVERGIPTGDAEQLAAGMAQLPIAVLVADGATVTRPSLLLTYVNFGEVELYGADLSVRALLGERWSLGATASLVSDDHFQNVKTQGELVPLNAPTRKGSLAVAYDDHSRLSGEVRLRSSAGFPASTGVFVADRCINPNGTGEACVRSQTVADLALEYRLPRFSGVALQLSISNVFDRPYRSFAGAPEIGRLALLRARYEF